MNFFNTEQFLGTPAAIRIANEDFHRFQLKFSHYAHTPYVIWIGLSSETYPRLVFKIHAPFCRSLNKAIKEQVLWRKWDGISRIWEIEFDSPHWPEIIDSIKNDTVQSLLEHLIYYQDQAKIETEIENLYLEIQKNFFTTRQLLPNNIVYGMDLGEFKNGLIHIRPNFRPDKQYVRVEVFGHKRYLGAFRNILKSFGYEQFHYHYDQQFKAWSFTVRDQFVISNLIRLNDNPDMQWINIGLERINDWFIRLKCKKIQVFDSYSGKAVEDELIESCRVETETGVSFFL